MTSSLFSELDTYEDRVNEVNRLVSQLPEPNKRMLEVILEHLENVSLKDSKNMMTVSNLGVCFGPTLLRAEEETVAAIMDIKFGNVVVEILIENWRQILRGDPPRVMPPQSPEGVPGAAGARGGQVTPQGSPTRRFSYGKNEDVRMILIVSSRSEKLYFVQVFVGTFVTLPRISCISFRFAAWQESHPYFRHRSHSASRGVRSEPGLPPRSDPAGSAAADDDLSAPTAHSAAAALPEPASPARVATDFALGGVGRGLSGDRPLPGVGRGLGDRRRECGQVGARCDIQQRSQAGERIPKSLCKAIQ